MNQHNVSQSMYRPLSPLDPYTETPPYTRLLLLAPEFGEGQPFHGQLELVEVLSYTRGPDEPTDYIWLQGFPRPSSPISVLLSCRSVYPICLAVSGSTPYASTSRM